MNRFNTTIGALLRTARTPSRRAWLGHPSSYSTHTAPTPPTACLSCHHALPSSSLTPLCPHCSTLLPPPPSSTSHFSLFSLSPTYTLDQKALKDQYRAYQQKVHPDLYLGKGQMEGWAREWSGRVNEAFRCLEGPRSRGEYLLQLSDIKIEEADSVTDPELLMAVMEVREELDEARTEEEVVAIRGRNQEEVKKTIETLAQQLDSESPDLDLARNLVIQLRYLENIDGVCKEWTAGKRNDVVH